MIEVKFYCAGADGSVHMEAAGHAGAAARGEDLVCAGVSALVWTLGGAVERLYEQRMLRRCPKVEIAEGRAEIIAVPKPDFREAVMLVFWTVQSGLGDLAARFPDNVAMEEAMRMTREKELAPGSGAGRREG